MGKARQAVVFVLAALGGLAAASAVAQQAAPAAEAPVPPPPAAPAAAAPGPIAATQRELARQGYDPGPANGVMTGRTERAIARYARRNGGRLPAALAAAAPVTAGGAADPVIWAQAGLKRLGLLAGPVDGILGPATRDAIIRFEAMRRLPIDPRVSDRLLAALEHAGSSAAAPPSPAPPPAAAAPAATGRQPLPAGVHPPPIR